MDGDRPSMWVIEVEAGSSARAVSAFNRVIYSYSAQSLYVLRQGLTESGATLADQPAPYLPVKPQAQGFQMCAVIPSSYMDARELESGHYS